MINSFFFILLSGNPGQEELSDGQSTKLISCTVQNSCYNADTILITFVKWFACLLKECLRKNQILTVESCGSGDT